MNDGLCVFLHLDEKQPEENEKLIERIDELLLTVGMKYCGVGNMYIPVHTEERDRAVFLAVQLLRETEWLKDISGGNTHCQSERCMSSGQHSYREYDRTR